MLTQSVVCGSAINIIANLALIPKYGAMGAVYASVLSELIVALVQLFMVRKELPIRQIFQIFCRYFGYSLLMLFVGLLLLHTLGEGVLPLLITVVVCIFVYTLCLFATHDPILSLIFSTEDSYVK